MNKWGQRPVQDKRSEELMWSRRHRRGDQASPARSHHGLLHRTHAHVATHTTGQEEYRKGRTVFSDLKASPSGSFSPVIRVSLTRETGHCDIVSWQPHWSHSPTGILPCTPLSTTPEEITQNVTPAVAAPPGHSRGP